MEIDLSSHGITRPHKVEWLVPSMPPEPLEIIRSKTTRKFLKNNLADFLTDSELTTDIKLMSQAEFNEWLPYYQAKMEENQFDVMANQSWYETKTQQDFKIHGIFIHQKGKLVGTGIVSESSAKKFTINFKASDKLESVKYRNASLGTIIEYLFLKLAYEHTATVISSGRSRNAFGVINKLGYLNFKLRFGYQPVTVTEEARYHTVEIIEGEPVCFYGYTDSPDNLTLYVYNHGQELSEQLKEVLVYTNFEVIQH